MSENIKKYVWNWKSWFSHFEVWLRYIKIKTKQRNISLERFFSQLFKNVWNIFYDTRSFLIFGKIIGRIVKKYGFVDFLGPELIIPNRTQDGTMITVNFKGPSFQQKNNLIPRGTTARDIWIWVSVIESNFRIICMENAIKNFW